MDGLARELDALANRIVGQKFARRDGEGDGWSQFGGPGFGVNAY